MSDDMQFWLAFTALIVMIVAPIFGSMTGRTKGDYWGDLKLGVLIIVGLLITFLAAACLFWVMVGLIQAGYL